MSWISGDPFLSVPNSIDHLFRREQICQCIQVPNNNKHKHHKPQEREQICLCIQDQITISINITNLRNYAIVFIILKTKLKSQRARFHNQTRAHPLDGILTSLLVIWPHQLSIPNQLYPLSNTSTCLLVCVDSSIFFLSHSHSSQFLFHLCLPFCLLETSSRVFWTWH